MLGQKWVFISILLLISTTFATSDDSEEEEHQEIVEEEEKEKYRPAQFQAPKFDEQSVQPNFFDFFPLGSKLGDKWIKSSAKKDDEDSDISKYNGVWEIGQPKTVTIEGDLGLVVKTKARHHAIAAKLDKPFKFDNDKFVVQYDVKFEEGQECGGGYLKLLSEGAEKDLKNFQDKTPYTIMFGPDKCGASGKVHLIFRYRNPINGSIDEYHAPQPSKVGTTYWDDHNTHLYTLIVKPTGDYSVNIDGKNLFYGNILSDVSPSLTPPAQIFDPTDVKPQDWDDRAEIEDESASKPADWDENEPKEVVDENATKPSDWNEDEADLIPDSEAVKPADWDDEMDGEWEPPMIDNPLCKGISGCGAWKPPTVPNPKYRGKWIRPKIANPAFKGVWSPRLIDNPNFFEPTPFGGLAPISAVGIELWTMSENIIFDNVLITSSEEDAADIAKQTFSVKQAEEYKLAAANGAGGGILNSILEAAEEKPWLWAVYILCIVLPLIFIGVFLFGRQSKPAPTNYAAKKTDAFSEDVPNLVDDDGEEENQPGPSGSQNSVTSQEDDEELEEIPGDVQKSAASSSAEEDEQQEEPHTVRENEPVQPTEELAKKSPKQTGGPQKRRTARRGD